MGPQNPVHRRFWRTELGCRRRALAMLVCPLVVFFNESTGSGGTERYLLLLARALLQRGTDVRILVPNHRPDEIGAFVATYERTGIPVEIVCPPRSLSAPRMISWFRRYFGSLRRTLGRNSILHFNRFGPTSNSSEIVGARLARIPAIVSTNQLPILGFGGLNLAGRTVARLARRSLDGVIVSCEANRRLSIRNRTADPRTISVIPHGIPVGSFPAPGLQREELGLEPDLPVLGS